jgi:uncharacterized protein DUF5995
VSASNPGTLESQLLSLAARLDLYRIRYEAMHDSRAVFTYAYVNITRFLASGLATSQFQNPDWVVGLARAFADEYFQALDAADQNRPVPEAWQKVFTTIRTRTSVLEDLIFAMTAHIVHDLPVALIHVGMADQNSVSHIRDFHRMNDVLGDNVQRIEDIVLRRYAPMLRWIDHLEKGYDQILSNYGFRLSRGMAWYNANRLLDPMSSAEAKASIIRSVIILIDNVRNPTFWPVRLLFRFGRFFVGLFRRWPR